MNRTLKLAGLGILVLALTVSGCFGRGRHRRHRGMTDTPVVNAEYAPANSGIRYDSTAQSRDYTAK